MSAMTPELALASLLLPLLFPLLALRRRWVGLMRYGLPFLPLPALALAVVTQPGWTLQTPHLLLGGLWVMDDLRQQFLLLTSLLWAAAGCFAIGSLGAENLRRFCICWGLTLAGNLGLIISGDIAGFYSCFALMTFAAYGLVIHAGDEHALRAGRVYVILALLGEMAMLTGFIMAAGQAGSLILADLAPALAGAGQPDLIIALLVAGFGVKAGLPLLHFWLPLAYRAAPTPASAVLSGAMINAGLLGWLLTLPLAEQALPQWGGVMVLFGAVAGLGAAALGVCQRDPKTVLAYSSISQMGLMTILLGVALADPQRAGVLVSVIALYALHHGFAKGVLFLSVGLALPSGRMARALVWLLIALPGFSLAGLPLTSGALAKLASKEALAPEGLLFPLAQYLSPLMTAISIATLLLVLRYLFLLRNTLNTGSNPAACWLGWMAATAFSAVLFWWMPWQVEGLVKAPVWLPGWHKLWALFWPLLVALLIGWASARLVSKAPGIPEGDGLVALEVALSATRRQSLAMARAVAGLVPGKPLNIIRTVRTKGGRWVEGSEGHLRDQIVLIMVLVVLALVLL